MPTNYVNGIKPETTSRTGNSYPILTPPPPTRPQFFISFRLPSRSGASKVHHEYFAPTPGGWYFRRAEVARCVGGVLCLGGWSGWRYGCEEGVRVRRWPGAGRGVLCIVQCAVGMLLVLLPREPQWGCGVAWCPPGFLVRSSSVPHLCARGSFVCVRAL